MPCRRALIENAHWDSVVIQASRRDIMWDMHAFLDSEDANGLFACVSRVAQSDDSNTTAWHFFFSDPRTAFEFKMRYG